MSWELNAHDWQLIDLALAEDLHVPPTDVTSQLLFARDNPAHTVAIVSKHATPVRVCGMPVVAALLSRLTRDYSLDVHYQDGQWLPAGQTLCTLHADRMSLLMAERTLLNFLRHLSAIATLTSRYVDAVRGFSIGILDTRKTTPGMRHLEKYAVMCGGGVNHRMGLYDAIMLKNNHVDLMGGMSHALLCLPAAPTLPVIVEVRNEEELAVVLREGLGRVTRILLDNMSPARMQQCVAHCRGRIATEASGNIDLSVIRAVAESGVDYASIGALTYSAGHVDLSMRVVS